jgi:hypothetical protein
MVDCSTTRTPIRLGGADPSAVIVAWIKTSWRSSLRKGDFGGFPNFRCGSVADLQPAFEFVRLVPEADVSEVKAATNCRHRPRPPASCPAPHGTSCGSGACICRPSIWRSDSRWVDQACVERSGRSAPAGCRHGFHRGRSRRARWLPRKSLKAISLWNQSQLPHYPMGTLMAALGHERTPSGKRLTSSYRLNSDISGVPFRGLLNLSALMDRRREGQDAQLSPRMRPFAELRLWINYWFGKNPLERGTA